MFDVELDLNVTIGTPSKSKSAQMCVRIRGGSPMEDTEGRWKIVRHSHPALPNHLIGSWHRWHWTLDGCSWIAVLETGNGCSWASLTGFPDKPMAGSKGRGSAYNLPIGPPDPAIAALAGSSGNHPLSWSIRAERAAPDISPIHDAVSPVFRAPFRSDCDQAQVVTKDLSRL